MKWMKYFLILAMGLAMGLGAAGCTSEDDEGGDSLVGSWRAQTYNGQSLGEGAAMSLTFRDNGTWTATSSAAGLTDSDTGTWSAENGIITTVANSNGQTEQTPYSISGDTLTMGAAGDVFVMTRQ